MGSIKNNAALSIANETWEKIWDQARQQYWKRVVRGSIESFWKSQVHSACVKHLTIVEGKSYNRDEITTFAEHLWEQIVNQVVHAIQQPQHSDTVANVNASVAEIVERISGEMVQCTIQVALKAAVVQELGRERETKQPPTIEFSQNKSAEIGPIYRNVAEKFWNEIMNAVFSNLNKY